jgi:hypothetical protein
MTDHIMTGLQAGIDENNQGWSVVNYAAVVGLSRINSDDQIETTLALYYADGQPDYTTEGLLIQGDRLRASVHEEQE